MERAHQEGPLRELRPKRMLRRQGIDIRARYAASAASSCSPERKDGRVRRSASVKSHPTVDRVRLVVAVVATASFSSSRPRRRRSRRFSVTAPSVATSMIEHSIHPVVRSACTRKGSTLVGRWRMKNVDVRMTYKPTTGPSDDASARLRACGKRGGKPDARSVDLRGCGRMTGVSDGIRSVSRCPLVPFVPTHRDRQPVD
jgi:hypothetical protein